MANLYVFHHGFGMNGELWYSVFDLDRSTWSPDRQVPNVGLSGSPSAVVYPGRGIYVFHQGLANFSGPFDNKAELQDDSFGTRFSMAQTGRPIRSCRT